jgi:hypothetical protein
LGVLLLGGTAASLDRDEALLRWLDTLAREAAPGAPLPREAAQRLLTTVEQHRLLHSNKLRWAATAKAYAPWLVARIPPVAAALDDVERNVVTELLLGSGFFAADRSLTAPLDYHPTQPACPNPFARYLDA